MMYRMLGRACPCPAAAAGSKQTRARPRTLRRIRRLHVSPLRAPLSAQSHFRQDRIDARLVAQHVEGRLRFLVILRAAEDLLLTRFLPIIGCGAPDAVR